VRALRSGSDNTDYIDKVLSVKQERIKFKQYLEEKYNYKKGEVHYIAYISSESEEI
jgi:hypothetical protein